MDFSEQLNNLSARAKRCLAHLQTEEATKQSLVIPFLQVMGFDPFDPTEVIPEYVADFGTKKGEKVDYAVMIKGKPLMLIECKWSGAGLENAHLEQLHRYFSVTGAKIGILTNGIIYRFYTDLEKSNQIDTRPFLEFNLLEIQKDVEQDLYKLTKQKFRLEEISAFAGDLKYTREIKQHLAAQMIEPTEDIIRLFASRVYSGMLRQSVIDQFKSITQRAFRQFFNEEVAKRLQNTFEDQDGSSEAPQAEKKKREIVTTPEEIEAFERIRATFTGSPINPERVSMRDALSYCAILLDNNNTKPIARLFFDEKNKKIMLFDGDKEEKINLPDLQTISSMGAHFLAAAKKYTVVK